MKFKYSATLPKYLGVDGPLIVTLHGMGSNMEDLPPIFSSLRNDFNNLNIEGNIDYMGGYAFYLASDDEFSKKEIVINVAIKLQKYIISIINEKNLSPKKIILLGFSQGALLSATLISLFPDFYSGAIILNGCLPSFVIETSKDYDIKKAIFIAQGSHDPLFAVKQGEELAEFFKAKGSNVTYKLYNTGHNINNKGVSDVCYFLTSFLNTK